MRLDIYHHHDEHSGRMERVLLGKILNKLEIVMRTLEETLAAVEAETSSIQSISTLLAGIKKQLDDALGGALTPSQQMRVDAIFNRATENKTAIDAAIKANDGIPDDDGKIESHVEAASSASPANVGDTIIFSGSVVGAGALPDGAPKPTGTITFSLDGNPLGTGTLDADGVAQYSVSVPLSPGDHQVVASYAGDGAYRTGQSDPLVQTIVAPGGQS